MPAGAGGQPGLALVDTPDLDSVEPANRQWTRRAIEAAVWSSTLQPEKVSNFEINREIRNGRARNAWFFALNKIDSVAPRDLEVASGNTSTSACANWALSRMTASVFSSAPNARRT